MPLTHQDLYDEARDAIQTLFSDTSVSPEETADSLRSMIDEIETLINTLEED